MSQQYQKYTKQPVHQSMAVYNFAADSANVAVDTGAGWATAVGTKVALSAANFSKALDPNGDITLDDANDRILLEPGVYEVSADIRLADNGIDSAAGVALTAAAGATLDYAGESGSSMVGGFQAGFHGTVLLNLSAARAVELHVAARTATGQVIIKQHSRVVVRRLGNPE